MTEKVIDISANEIFEKVRDSENDKLEYVIEDLRKRLRSA